MRRTAFLIVFLTALQAGAAGVTGVTFVTLDIPEDRFPYSIGPGTDRIWHADVAKRRVGYMNDEGFYIDFQLADPVDAANEFRPLSIIEGLDGNGWFTFYITNGSGSPLNRSGVGRITPTGELTTFPLPTGNACRGFFGRPDCALTIGPDMHIWLVETQTKKVAKVSPGGEITEFTIDAPGFFPVDITTGPDGNLWIADYFGGIFRMTTAGVVTEYSVPGGLIIAIAAGPDGNLWFTNAGGNAIGRITPSGVRTSFPLPRPNSQVRDIVAAADGQIYFTETLGFLGRIDPQNPAIQETAIPDATKATDIVTSPALNAEGQVELFVQVLKGTKEGATKATVTTAPNGVGSRLTVKKEAFQFDSVSLEPLLLTRVIRKGSLMAFRMTVTNEGQGASVVDWSIEDALPDGCHFDEDSQYRTEIVFGTLCELTRGVLTCRKSELNARSLASKQSAEITFVCEASEAGLFLNKATVKGQGSPPHTSDAAAFVVLESRQYDNVMIEETLRQAFGLPQ